MYIIKLGGSVITDKAKKNIFKKEVTSRLMSEIMESGQRVILVHGAGSFGHILAKEYGLHEGYRSESQLSGVAEVQRDVKNLSLKVLDACLAGGMYAVSLAPSAFVVNDKAVIKHMDASIFKRYLDLGITPITFGDVVVDESLVFSIVSGDQLMLMLAKAFRPKTVVFVADVDGIFTGDPSADDRAELLPVVDKETLSIIGNSESKVSDVTGGIFGKSKIMLEIAAHGMETIILNGTVENRLRDALMGKDVLCTKFMKID
ncbi:MAG: isopentenyl phosphate kinase family protein [Thermoplasmata archaeon]|nr:MAG: isopentenyl phosphate kinase family protein [Thermoplasmata archaeon]